MRMILTVAARKATQVMRVLNSVKVQRFFWDSRRFTTISRAYWRIHGPAAGRTLHHWLIPQRWTWVPEGLRNAGFNLLQMPGIMVGSLNLNTWMGFAIRWGGYRWVLALGAESSIRVLIPMSIVGGAAAGAAAGDEAVEILSREWTPEDLQKEANTLGNILGPLPADEEEGAVGIDW
jgi:hypothetical protein